jgi:hypothetical protein
MAAPFESEDLGHPSKDFIPEQLMMKTRKAMPKRTRQIIFIALPLIANSIPIHKESIFDYYQFFTVPLK